MAEQKTVSEKHDINPVKGMIFAALFAAFTAAIAPFKIPLGFTPVPITLQTLAVLLSGAVLGPLYGAIAMILYIAVGALGLPVFAGGGSGLGAILGPTGGYLLSYPVAAFAIGFIVKFKKSAFVKYLSLVVLLFLLSVIYADIFFKLGAIEAIAKMPDSQRLIIGTISLTVIILLGAAAYYLTKKKDVSVNTALAMVAGTLIIYLMGAVHGQFVTKLPWNAIFVGWVLPFLIGDTIKLLVAAYIAANIEIGKYLK